MNKRAWWISGAKAAPLVGLIICLAYFFLFTQTGIKLSHMNVGQLSDYLLSFGTYSVILGMAAVYVQSILPFFPFVLVAGANVLVFGLAWGFVINYVMSVAGALTAFGFARTFGHDRVERRLSKYPAVLVFNKRLEEQGFLYVMLGRMIPILPSSAISFGAGISKIRTRDFIMGTVIGKLPMILLESLIGHDLLHFRQYRGRLLLLVALFLLLTALGSMVKNKLSGKTAK